MQLYFAVFICVFGYGIADVESAFGFDEASVTALSKGNARDDVARLVVNEFEFDMLLSSAHHFACAIVIDI